MQFMALCTFYTWHNQSILTQIVPLILFVLLQMEHCEQGSLTTSALHQKMIFFPQFLAYDVKVCYYT